MMEIEKQPLLFSSSNVSTVSSGYPVPSSLTYLIVLAAICFVSINNFFCYHEPSAIALQFETFYQLDTKQFGTLFTIYSAPNVILVFFSGQFIDTYGLRRSSLLFNVLILISMLLAAITPKPSNNPDSYLTPQVVYVMLLFSRLLLGLGGESLCACVSTMVSRWFSSTQHLNTAMALNQAIVQLFGSAAAFYILPHAENIVLCQWITVGVCVISVLANLIYNYYESTYDNYLNDANELKDIHQHVEHHVNGLPSTNNSYQSTATTATTVDSHLACSANSNDIDNGNNVVVSAKNVLSQSMAVLRQFPMLFWLLLIHISLLSPILYTFTAFGPMYLQESFPATKTATQAGDAISLLYMSIVAAPFTGMLIDAVGYRAQVQFLASCNIPIIFLLLTYDYLPPNLCMVWMGVIFSITESNGLALISLVVPSELTGTAFGVFACCISVALLIEPAAVGLIREFTGSFAWSIWMFFLLTVLGSLAALLVILYDQRHDRIISKSAKDSVVL